MKCLLTIFLIGSFLSNAHAQNVELITDSLMTKNNIPELGFAVISPDSILELKVFGYHRIDLKNEQTKAGVADYFHLGSNTKAITGFVAARLVESGAIQWNTKFFDVFPDWKRDSNPAYHQITLTDLLSHRAKIQPYTSGLEFEKLPKFSGNPSEKRKQFAQYLLKEKPVNDTTAVYHYSNAGYSIAALLLEKVSGKTWEQLIKQTMTDTLGLPVVFGFPNRFNVNEPYGHWIENDTLKALPPDVDYNLALIEPAGDISMTLPDYAKFIQLNLQGLEGKNSFLKSSTYNFLHFGLKDYSIGWGNYKDASRQLSQHSGSAGTFYCYTLLDKTHQQAYVIVANSATDDTQKAIVKLSKVMQKKYSK